MQIDVACVRGNGVLALGKAAGPDGDALAGSLKAVHGVADFVNRRHADAGKISADDIDESLFAEYLDTKGVPDPDLLIRTSGEERTSNFLPWQLAYSEFYFTDTLWPDFDMDSLIEAVRYYNKRERRFGDAK